MNKVKRRKIKRSANLKLLFFTFFGAFILFFLAFTYLLPVITPQVEIPALTEDHVFNSITSHDFRGRIDPRLHSVELQEEMPAEKKKETPVPKKMPAGNISPQDKMNKKQKTNKSANVAPLPGKKLSGQTSQTSHNSINATVPPRPGPLALKEGFPIVPPAPVFKAKVIVGEFTSPKEAGLTSEILVNLNYEPFIRERNGKYILQIASFSDAQKAQALLKELKNRNFDAKIIYE